MKSNIGTLLIAIIFLSLTSCDKNNDELQEIEGVWNLHNVSGGFAGINIDYSIGEVTWDFKSATEQVSIKNNIESTGPEQIYSGPETGSYNFDIKSSDVLEIENLKKGEFNIKGDTLVLSDGDVADGLTTIFVK